MARLHLWRRRHLRRGRCRCKGFRSTIAAAVDAAGVCRGKAGYAVCSNPAVNETDITYNGDYHTYQFCNGTNWVSMSSIGTSGPFTLISTQTASSSASLQFTGLPSTYNTLFLNCTGLLSSSNSAILKIYVGEGATLTWETGALYLVVPDPRCRFRRSPNPGYVGKLTSKAGCQPAGDRIAQEAGRAQAIGVVARFRTMNVHPDVLPRFRSTALYTSPRRDREASNQWRRLPGIDQSGFHGVSAELPQIGCRATVNRRNRVA